MSNLLESAEGVFRLLVDEAKEFAIFLLDAGGVIETWNLGAQRAFGYAPEEIIGKQFAILFTAADRESGAPERELEHARTIGRGEDARWQLRKDGSTFFADGVTTPIFGSSHDVIGFAKIARDVTERYLTGERLAAQLALTNILNEEAPVGETARRFMKTACENLHWDIGALWHVQGERLECIDQWHAADIDPDRASALCRGHTFSRGEGLPGQVWESAEALWIADLTASSFPRGAQLSALGMKAAFAFPILHAGSVTGIMEFFSRTRREPDQALLPIMTLIGAQIGDFIDRRRTAETLRESEERYRVVSETAQDAIFTIDAASTILFCNAAVERMFGYKPAEMIGRNLDMIIPERLRDAHRKGIARYLQTHKQHIPWSGVELPALRRDGQEFPAEIMFGVYETETRTVFTGFARDITERRRAVEEQKRLLAKEQEARAEAEGSRLQLERRADEEVAFRHLASALTGAAEMTDVLYEITNRATQVTRADGVYVERIISPQNVEVVASAGRGTPPRGLRVSFPGSLTEEILRQRQPVILADMGSFGRAMAPYLIDTCPSCQVLMMPLVAENEPLGALVLLNSKQSGRMFGDADVIRARTLGDLTSLALRRVRLLEQERDAKEKAEQALRVRDETLGIVSHDLRNPLTKIALSADLLAEAPPEEHSELIETIRVSARQMQRLIEDLLDVARLESGRFSVNAKKVSPQPIVRYACESNEPLAEQKHQRIDCQIEEGLPEICADRDRLLQVFSNLVGNAMKFTPEGGTIMIEARDAGRDVLFRVSDNGPGIPDAEIQNVFRPYWQAKKTAHMGAGLGLAIVRGIVEAHGGKASAENPPGGGAVFTFTIPKV